MSAARRKPLKALNQNLFEDDWLIELGSSSKIGFEDDAERLTAARGKKKKARARRAVRPQEKKQQTSLKDGAKEDIEWLLARLEQRSRLGVKVVIRPPVEWRRSRRRRFIAWCEELDFSCTSPPVLEIETSRVLALVAGLHQAIAAQPKETTPVDLPNASSSLPSSPHLPSSPMTKETSKKTHKTDDLSPLESSITPATKERSSLSSRTSSNEDHIDNLSKQRISPLRKRRTVAARRASLMTPAPTLQEKPPHLHSCAIAVGAWLTGEIYKDQLIVTEDAESRIARTPDLDILLVDGSERVIVKSSIPTWPTGKLLQTANNTRYYCTLDQENNISKHWPLKILSQAMKWLSTSAELEAARAVNSFFCRAADDGPRAALCARTCFQGTITTKSIPRGAHAWKFLSEGAFKRVYLDTHQQRAVAVADLDIFGNDAAALQAAQRELEISFLLTGLALRAQLPNFVSTYSAFRRTKAPHTKEAGRYLYLNMELCDYGDLQSYIERQPERNLSAPIALAALFQLCFALYTGRAAFALRHYDLKLLNCLASPLSTPGIRYFLGSHCFRIPASESSFVLKLADFGTSRYGSSQLGQSASGAIFSTIENAPPELMTHGDTADLHTFEADTFSLGLSALHLLTGDAPYEEILDTARAPATLIDALATVWLARKNAQAKHSFFSLKRILTDCCPDQDDTSATVQAPRGYSPKYLDRTLFDTLYRYLVLFGLPDDQELQNDPFYTDSNIWKALASTLSNTSSEKHLPSTRTSKRTQQNHDTIQESAFDIFQRDSARFSLSFGDHPSISRAREKLNALPAGAKTAFLSTLNFNPQKRPTMRVLLESPLFESFRTSIQVNKDDLICRLYHRNASQVHLPLPDV